MGWLVGRIDGEKVDVFVGGTVMGCSIGEEVVQFALNITSTQYREPTFVNEGKAVDELTIYEPFVA